MPENEEQKAVIRAELSGEMTIQQACARKAELGQILLRSGSAIELNLSGVSDIDTAGVQLLLALKGETSAQRRHLQLVEHSPVVLAAFERYNLGSYFGDPLFLPADSASVEGDLS